MAAGSVGYLVEGRAAFAEMGFRGVDVVAHDKADRCIRTSLTIALHRAVYIHTGHRILNYARQPRTQHNRYPEHSLCAISSSAFRLFVCPCAILLFAPPSHPPTLSILLTFGASSAGHSEGHDTAGGRETALCKED